jgi:hypothetical protein
MKYFVTRTYWTKSLKDSEIFNSGYEINNLDISLRYSPVCVRVCVCVSLCDDPVGHLLT